MSNNDPPVWERLDQLDDAELNDLVEAAVAVITEAAGDPDATSLAELPARRLGAEITVELQSSGVVANTDDVGRLLRDERSARPLVLSMLRSLPAGRLRDEVEAAYAAKRKMMIVDAGLLTGAALLLLVMKLKRIKIGSSEISFYEAKSETVDGVRQLLGG